MKTSNILKRTCALLFIAVLIFQNSACFAAESDGSVNVARDQSSGRILSKSILNAYETDTNDENSFFSLTSRIRYLDRWVLFQNLEKKEDLADHSLEVAMIAHAIALIHNKIAREELSIEGIVPEKIIAKKKGMYSEVNAERAALLGIYHDMPEIVTGDIPTPTKHYDKNMEKSCDQAEDKAVSEMMSLLPEEFREDYSKVLKHSEEEKELWVIVKAGDTLSAVIKCLREKKVGNNDFDKVLRIYTQKIKAIEDPAVIYFVKTFMPSFGFKCPDEVPVSAPVVKNEW